jgi:hypothetical protein
MGVGGGVVVVVVVQFGCEASCVGFGLDNVTSSSVLGVLYEDRAFVKSRAAVDELFKCRGAPLVANYHQLLVL